MCSENCAVASVPCYAMPCKSSLCHASNIGELSIKCMPLCTSWQQPRQQHRLSTTHAALFEVSAGYMYSPLVLSLDVVDLPDPFSEFCTGSDLLSLKQACPLMLQTLV